nr:putative ribonuclease H-like domain-containing protein [Tanacetum cinerariifolium]
DETTPVLKTFILGLKNLLSLTVKVIRCDNGTEFKNSDLNQLYGLKGIKREFSVPRIPQQNSIAERKNMTLIEAARTLLADLLLFIPFWAEINKYWFHETFWLSCHHFKYPGPLRFTRYKKAEEEVTYTYVLFLVLSDGSTSSQNKNKDALIDGKEHDDDI